MLFIVLWIPAAIRYGIGTDYFSYVDYYNDIKYGGISRKLEVGFIFIYKLLIMLNLDVQWFFVITSFFTILFTLLSFKKHFYFSVLLYNLFLLYLYSYNIVRQALAVAIVMYAISNIIRGNAKKYVFLVCMASLFHISAILFLPFFLFSKINYKITIPLMIIIILSIVQMDIKSFIENLPMVGKYAFYFNNSFYGVQGIQSVAGILVRAIPIFFAVLLSKKIFKENCGYNFIIVLSFSYLMALILARKFFIFYRLIQLFLIAQVFIIPLLLKSIRPSSIFYSSLRYGIFFLVIVFNLFIYERYITNTKNEIFNGVRNIIPYESIFVR
jgi:hypothetical protein